MRYLTMGQMGRATLNDGDYFDCIFFQVEQLVQDGWYSFLLMIMYGVQVYRGCMSAHDHLILW